MRGLIKRICSYSLIFVMVFGVIFTTFNVKASANETVKVMSNITAFVGENVKIKLKDIEEDATVNWSSKNKKIATVDINGKVKAKKAGETKIIATVEDEEYVYKLIVKNISISNKNVTLYSGKSITLKLLGANSKKVKWKSSNELYATVNSKGKVVTKPVFSTKKVKITASYNNKKYVCTVAIKPYSLKEVSTINYLALGNSITKHPIKDYWWNECGMAASGAQYDYVHRTAEWLRHDFKDKEVNYKALNIAKWETESVKRSSYLKMIDPYISKSTNLVTILVGENVSDSTTFEKDYIKLIEYIRKKAPKANIIIVTQFWPDKTKDKIIRNVAKKCNTGLADIKYIVGKKEYQAQVGQTVYDASGGAHIIEDEIVAAHPGDLGMQYIAKSIIKAVRKIK